MMQPGPLPLCAVAPVPRCRGTRNPVRALPRPARVEAVRVSERSTKGAPVQCARTGGRAALAMLTPPAALRRAARLLMTMLLLASVLLVAGLVVQGAVFVGRQYVPVRDPDTPADVFPAGSAAPMAAGEVAARPADASRGGGSGYRKLVAKASNLLSRVDAQRALDQRTLDGPAAQAMPVAAVVASATSRPRAPRDDGGAIVPRLWQARRERPGLAPAHQPRKPHDPGDANDGGTEGRTPESPSADGDSGTVPSAPAEPGGGSGGPVAEAPPGAPAPAPATPPPRSEEHTSELQSLRH